jgi:hypothetical protein
MKPDLHLLLGSGARAAVLAQLCAGWTGTVSELARRCGYSVRQVADEVRLLAGLSVVDIEAVGNADLVRLSGGPVPAALKQLVRAAGERSGREELASVTRASLAALGAPLAVVKPVLRCAPHEAVIQGIELAREDGTLLRVLPVVLARNEDTLDWSALKELARRRKLKAELGMLLELTSQLTERPAFAAMAEDLRDRRRTARRYFPHAKSAYERALAEQRSPKVARRWGFFMNLSEESFRSTLSRHGA